MAVERSDNDRIGIGAEGERHWGLREAEPTAESKSSLNRLRAGTLGKVLRFLTFCGF